MENIKEKWKPIFGYKRYQVSDMGNIKSFCNSKVRILRNIPSSNGYQNAKLFDDYCVGKRFWIHRLVSQHFVDNPKKLKYVNHKNGVKMDNRAENLEWVTASDNLKHAFRTGLHKHFDCRGEKCPNSKLNGTDVLKIRALRDRGLKYKELSEKFDVSIANIHHICKRKSWSHL